MLVCKPSFPGFHVIHLENCEQKCEKTKNPLIISGFMWCWEQLDNVMALIEKMDLEIVSVERIVPKE